MRNRIAILVFMLLLPVFSCFSLADSSSIEIETPVDMSRILTAKNVNLGIVGSFRNPIDPKTAIIFNEMGFRLVFPTTDSEFFSCDSEEKYLFVKENCSTGTVTSDYGERIYYVGDTFTFEALNPPCTESECTWKLSLDYLTFPREYLINCWNNVVWSCKLVNKSVVLGYGEIGIKQTLRGTLNNLVENQIIDLDYKDVEKIVNISKLGYSGHNNRLVNFEGEWMPYRKTKDAELIREITVGGCENNEILTDIPENIIQFSNPFKNQFSILFRKFFEFFGLEI